MRWLSFLNAALVVILICVCALFFFFFSGEKEILTIYPRIEREELPPSSFSDLEEHDLSSGPFSLNWVPPLMQLPDLRNELQFFGENGRPDMARGKLSFHLGLKSSTEVRSVRENERVYLIYQGNYASAYIDRTPYREPISLVERPLWGDVSVASKGSYHFSPDNQPTPLWLEIISSSPNSLSLSVKMLDEKAVLVKKPSELREITLTAQEFPKSQTAGWELGGYRVDSTLLVRQKARWIGSDRFLEMHGGDEYAFAFGKEKIDFLDGETPYSCFAGPRDFLVWRGGRWNTPMQGENTEGLPILCIKKIDEKIMTLELWDGQGRAKTTLSLIRSKDHNKSPDLAQEFKFVGVKTWAQFIVECRNSGRLTLKPNDWLVLTQEGWKKLDSPDQIDAYVNGSLIGPLFVLDTMIKQNGRQILVGHLFNLSRTEVEEVELEAGSKTSLANSYRTFPLDPPTKSPIEGLEE
ncbi:MAG: hypothetical protein JJU12_02800 [Chlamydiales bacterium]|nr:hypothetical protein [Chlamydiales bacterium]